MELKTILTILELILLTGFGLFIVGISLGLMFKLIGKWGF